MSKAYNEMEIILNITNFLIELAIELIETYTLFETIDVIVESLK
jgi:hypothetical protein